MARSYQKVPGWTNNGPHTRYAKRQANKRVRHTWDIPNGTGYRRVFNTWDIHDFKQLEYHPESYRRELLAECGSDSAKFNKWWYRAWMKK